MKTVQGACGLCDATCGIEVDIGPGDEVVAIRGDEQDPFSRGHVCPKAFAHADLLRDEGGLRVTTPRVRQGERWLEVSWEDALQQAATRLAEIQRRHGRDAVGIYLGTPIFQSFDTTAQAYALSGMLRSKNRYSANSIDALPLALACKLVFGSQAAVPVPDLERVDHWLVIGANPLVSNGSAMTAPGMRQRLKQILARGGEVVTVDPRRSETARRATRHHFIRPGTDAALLLAMLNVIFGEGLRRPGRLAPHLRHEPQLKRAAAAWPPERAAEVTGVPAEEIQRMARDLCRHDRAVCYGRMGISTQEFGTLATCLMHGLNALAGNLDREGGAMFPEPAVDLAGLAAVTGQTGDFDRWRSRVEALPEFNGELPVTAMASEMETPGEGQLRALICVAGNPALSAPNGSRLQRALARLDFLLVVDPYINESGQHAHMVLPPHIGLEREHYPALPMGLAVRNTAKYVPRLVEPPPGTRSDGEIMHALGQALLGQTPVLGRAISGLMGKAMPPGATRALRLAMRTGPHGGGVLGRGGITLERVLATPAGIDLGPLSPRLPRLLGERGYIDLLPREAEQDLARLEASTQRRPDEAGLVLVSRRLLRANNTWMNHCPGLSRGKDPCVLEMNPADAGRLELQQGQTVRVRGEGGSLQAPVKISAHMMPGVVSFPFGFGRLSVNDVTDDRLMDRLSGTACFFGVPVSVEPVE